jgi:polyisoprenyl-phosphate glycosyltransferase
MQQVLILCPFYNDQASFNAFARETEQVAGPLSQYRFQLLVVDDGSDEPCKPASQLPASVVHLHRNIGHQKAIAIGLAYAHHHLSFDKVVVMDCDGEDAPADIEQLLQASAGTEKIVFASRKSRQDGRRFRFFYYLYKVLFKLLTGRKISFGNFMLLPAAQVRRLVYFDEIWNHLAGGVLRSDAAYVTVNTHKGRRYAGASKMSFMRLFLHGLSAIGVFIDIIASRLLILSFALTLFSVAGIAVILYLKFFTNKAIPGWATTGVSSMLIILLQSFLLSLFTVFLFLSLRGQRKFIPANHYMDYVRSVD